MASNLKVQSMSFPPGCRSMQCFGDAPQAPNPIVPSPSRSFPNAFCSGVLCEVSGRSSVVFVTPSASGGISKAVLYGCISAGAMVLVMLGVAVVLLMRWRSRKRAAQTQNPSPSFVSHSESLEPMVIAGNKRMSTIFYVKVNPNSPLVNKKPASDVPTRKTGQVHNQLQLPSLPSAPLPRVVHAGGVNDEDDILSEKPIYGKENPYYAMSKSNTNLQPSATSAYYAVPIVSTDSAVGPVTTLLITNPNVANSLSGERKVSEQVYLSLDQVTPSSKAAALNSNAHSSRKVSNPLYEPGLFDRKVSNPIYGYSSLPGLSEETDALYDVPKSPRSGRKPEGLPSPTESGRKVCESSVAPQEVMFPREETYSTIDVQGNGSDSLACSTSALENDNVLYE